MKTILLLWLLVPVCVLAQDTFNGCPPTGDAKNQMGLTLNPLKNRWQFDPDVQVDTISFDQMVHAKELAFDVNHMGVLTAYVYGVKISGTESCECHDQDSAARDYHITLTKDAQHTQGKDRIIVELTSRVRTHHPEWELGLLKNLILHKTARFTGMFFRDDEHKGQSWIDTPNNPRDFRGSRWEFHPLKDIEPLE